MLRIEPYFNVNPHIHYTPEQLLAINSYLGQHDTIPSLKVMHKSGSVFAIFNDTAYKMASWIVEKDKKGVEILPVFLPNGLSRGKFNSSRSFGPLHLIKLFKQNDQFVKQDWKVMPIHFGFASWEVILDADQKNIDELLSFDFLPSARQT